MSKKLYCSLSLKFLIVVLVIIGVIDSYFHGFATGPKCFLYFTIISNILIGLYELITGIILLIKKNEYEVKTKIGYLLTVSITLTGIVYSFILFPGFLIARNSLDLPTPSFVAAFFLHVLVPLFATVDFFMTKEAGLYQKQDLLLSLILPFLYFLLTLVGFFSNWDFGHGHNYPYFFLDYNNPLGLFKISTTMPFLGSFYYIVLATLIILLAGYIFIKIKNKKRN